MSRMEPTPRDGGIEDGLAARIHDPLWLLARQWQLGEFAGQDSGSPAVVDVAASTHLLDGWRPATGPWQAWAVGGSPLERLVEQEAPVPGSDPVLRRDWGLRWLRLLGESSAAQKFVAGCGWPAGDAPAPSGLAAVIASRTPDGALVAASLRLLLDGATADDEAQRLGLDAAGRAAAVAAAPGWLAGWDARAPAGPAPDSLAPVTWDPHRLEHAFAVRASTLADAELAATGYPGGRLDWPSVDVTAPADGSPGDPPEPTPLAVRGIPAPARFGGMPTPRFWEMEDGTFDPGSIDAAPHDLARLLLVSYATVYGNDWFVVPVRLPVGTLLGVDTFTVTDVFGGTTTLQPAAAGDPEWNLFGLTDDREPTGSSPWFLLAPSLPDSLAGPPLESVLLARDEMANLAWAVELLVTDAAGGSASRFDAWVAGVTEPVPDPVPRYQVDTVVPDFWFPLAPEQLPDQESVRLRLVPLSRRIDGDVVETLPLGVLLADARREDDPVWLHEEEVPRSGLRVTRSVQRARWHDGSVHTWTARRRGAGGGESSSGLSFDTVRGPGG